jgi:hypothetical protein
MQARSWAGTGAALVIAIIGAAASTRTTGPATIAIDILLAIGVAALIRRWLQQLGDRLTDTTEERRKLQEDQAKCLAATSANNALRERLRHEAAETQRAAEQQIADATERIRREFEEARTRELCEAYYEGAMNERNGLHNKDNQAASADLIILSERRRTAPSTEAVRDAGLTP